MQLLAFIYLFIYLSGSGIFRGKAAVEKQKCGCVRARCCADTIQAFTVTGPTATARIFSTYPDRVVRVCVHRTSIRRDPAFVCVCVCVCWPGDGHSRAAAVRRGPSGTAGPLPSPGGLLLGTSMGPPTTPNSISLFVCLSTPPPTPPSFATSPRGISPTSTLHHPSGADKCRLATFIISISSSIFF